MNIYEKMQAITSELSAVAKNLEVDMGKNSYRAVGEADVLAAVKPLEKKHGVYSYPTTREEIHQDTYTDKYDKMKFFLRLKTVYRFINIEKPDEYIDITTYGDGVDSQDKAPGKAMTYADKYALLKAYKIITGDDPDQKASEDLQPKHDEQISSDIAEGIKKAIIELDIDTTLFCKAYRVASVDQLSYSQMGAVNRAIDKKRKQNADKKPVETVNPLETLK